MAFQLDLPKFEAANAQVLGVSVDFNNANTIFAERLGLRFPLLSDTRRIMTREYGVLNDNPAMANDAKRIAGYLRAKRAWFIIDKAGKIAWQVVNSPADARSTDDYKAAIAALA